MTFSDSRITGTRHRELALAPAPDYDALFEPWFIADRPQRLDAVAEDWTGRAKQQQAMARSVGEKLFSRMLSSSIIATSSLTVA